MRSRKFWMAANEQMADSSPSPFPFSNGGRGWGWGFSRPVSKQLKHHVRLARLANLLHLCTHERLQFMDHRGQGQAVKRDSQALFVPLL